ncbi:carbohydrate-binding protein [Chitinilyticum litopenaei]|uniref:carbohydrate-binding protein n=1 Tax=Chitinilyticum litopenaei TaxID=1121276 RepID=UPI00130DC20E|nr:carbohydrate-binding protein [Chitinilyticum litopenaei]
MKTTTLSTLLIGLLLAAGSHAATAWQEGSTYSSGSVVSYNGRDYQALTTHTAHIGANWNPAGTPTLWKDLGASSATTPTATPTPTCPSPPPSPSGGATPVYLNGCIVGWSTATRPPTATPTATTTPTVTPTATPTAASSCYPGWTAKAYPGGSRVTHNGRDYEARWWAEGSERPDQSGQWGAWKDIGACNSTTPTATVTSTITPSPTPLLCPVPTPPNGPATPIYGTGDLKNCIIGWNVTITPPPTPNPLVNLVSATSWKHGANGAYSLLHDDYCSMYYGNDPYIKLIEPALTQRGLVAGFGVITGNCSEQHWAAAKTMVANGHEIVSHSRTHPDPYIADAALHDQLNGAAADIAARLDGYQASYFVWPGDAASAAGTDFLKNGTAYLGGRATHLVANGGVDYTTMPAGINPANFDNPYRIKWDLFTVDGKWSLYPMGSEILNLHVDAAISQGAWATRTMHSVDTGYWETAPLDRYTAHLDYVKAKVDAGLLWMAGPSDVIRYRFARQYCKPVLGGDLRSVTFDTSAPECAKYATPITLQLNPVNAIAPLAAFQAGKQLPVAKRDNKYYVTANPLAGVVELR